MARPIRKTEYNPQKHCGSKNRQGSPCCNPAGYRTSHLGTGRCNLHGGASTGAKSVEGKLKVSKNSQKHNLYGNSLTEKELEYYNFVKNHTCEYILSEDFYLIHALLASAIAPSREEKYKPVLEMCRELVSESKIQQETYYTVRNYLSSPNLTSISKILSTTATLATTLKKAEEHAKMRREVQILMQLVKDVLQHATDVNTRRLAVNCIASLKLGAGSDVTELLQVS